MGALSAPPTRGKRAHLNFGPQVVALSAPRTRGKRNHLNLRPHSRRERAIAGHEAGVKGGEAGAANP